MRRLGLRGLTRLIAVVLFLAFCVSLVPLSGCGGDSPEAAVRKYLSAWQEGDWVEYKETVVPERRKLSKEEDELAKQKFEQIEIKFEDIKMETTYDKKDKNRGTVSLISGKVSMTADVLGEPKTETKELPMEGWGFDVRKVNGAWYVDRSPG